MITKVAQDIEKLAGATPPIPPVASPVSSGVSFYNVFKYLKKIKKLKKLTDRQEVRVKERKKLIREMKKLEKGLK